MNEMDSVKIARIDEKVINMGKWQEQHSRDDESREIETNAKFERVFNYIRERHDKTDAKIESLWDDKNQRKGALNLGRLVSSLIGGFIVIIAEFISNMHSRG